MHAYISDSMHAYSSQQHKQERTAHPIHKHDAKVTSPEKQGPKTSSSPHEIAANKAHDHDDMGTMNPDEFDQNSFMADQFAEQGCHDEWESIQRAWAELNADIAAKRSDVCVCACMCVCMYVWDLWVNECVCVYLKHVCVCVCVCA
jgi:hypothetical protein